MSPLSKSWVYKGSNQEEGGHELTSEVWLKPQRMEGKWVDVISREAGNPTS